LRLPVGVLDFLPAEAVEGKVLLQVSAEQWAAILADCVERAEDNEARRDAMIRASVRLALQRAGKDTEVIGDPRIALVLESAPAVIRKADIPLSEKYALARLTADVPECVLAEAQQQACETLELRQRILWGDPYASGLPEHAAADLAEMQAKARPE